MLWRPADSLPYGIASDASPRSQEGLDSLSSCAPSSGVNGHVDLLRTFIKNTVRFLLTVKGVEPAYHGLSDFVASGTVYRPLVWVVGAWILVAALCLVSGRRRDIPLLTLLGGGLYVLMLSRRPGDTMVYAIVALWNDRAVVLAGFLLGVDDLGRELCRQLGRCSAPRWTVPAHCFEARV